MLTVNSVPKIFPCRDIQCRIMYTAFQNLTRI